MTDRPRPAHAVAVRHNIALARCLAALAVLQAGVFLFVLWATIIRAPFENMLDWLDAYRRYREDGGLLDYLFQFFQEHRLVWVRLLTALDASAFQTSGLPFIMVGIVALGGVASMLTREFVHANPPRSPLAALAWLCPMLVLTTANAVDCSVPVNIVYPLTLFFVVGACVLFDGRGEGERHLGTRRAFAVALAAGAGLGNAVGLLVWPVLIWSAWRCRAGSGWLAAITVLAACYGLAYLHGLLLPHGAATPPASTLAYWAKLLEYLLAYLGLPLSRVPALRPVGEGLGAVWLAAGLWAVLRYGLLAREVTRLQRIATGLILFSLGSAVLAAAGRSHFATGIEIPVRYTVLVMPLHVGLLALLLHWLGVHPSASRRSGAVLAGGVAAGILILAQQLAVGRSAITVATTMRATIDRYYAGERDEQITRLVYQNGLPNADAIVAGLRRDGLLAR